jgi:hypothetical protein
LDERGQVGLVASRNAPTWGTGRRKGAAIDGRDWRVTRATQNWVYQDKQATMNAVGQVVPVEVEEFTRDRGLKRARVAALAATWAEFDAKAT